DDRRTPGHGPLPLLLPDQLAGPLVKRQEDRVAAIEVLDENDQVLVQQRAGTYPMRSGDAVQIEVPQRRALEIATQEAAGTEEGDDPFAVGHGSRGGVAVLFHHPFRLGNRPRTAPEQAAVGAVETVERPRAAVR